MSFNNGKRKNKSSKSSKLFVGAGAKQVLEHIDDSNPVMLMFKKYSSELTDKHDRYERIVKISRDITIESKRIIFLLHNVAFDIDSVIKGYVFIEAENRLKFLLENSFRNIALELIGHDHYMYLRAYTSGIQEYIEALLFMSYLKEDNLKFWLQVHENFFCYHMVDNAGNVSVTPVLFPQQEFILAIGDFTGELMRKCINSLGSGNVDNCFKICEIMKQIYIGYQSVSSPGYKELGRKLNTLKQSLLKVEFVCYNIRVRGSEIPRHMLADVIGSAGQGIDDQDEGYY